jgi:hypothetical protein
MDSTLQAVHTVGGNIQWRRVDQVNITLPDASMQAHTQQGTGYNLQI